MGYPLDDITPANQGRMHATTPANIRFTHANDRVYLSVSDGVNSNGITSHGGNSGGPVCVQYDDGNYLPAAIYLGGTTQTRVRVIDSDVITLFDSAEESGNTGQNSTNGGVPQINSSSTAPSSGTLTVTIEPPAARDAGAGWRIGGGGFLASGQSIPFLSPGGYTVTSKSIAGFVTPGPLSVNLTPSSPTVPITYVRLQPPVIEPVALPDAVAGQDYAFQVTATNGATAFSASGLPPNLTMSGSALITGKPARDSGGLYNVTITAANAAGATTKNLPLLVREPGVLAVSFDATSGNVSGKPVAVHSGRNVLGQGARETLTATAKSIASLPAGWVLDGATAMSSTDRKLTFIMTEFVSATANFVPNPFLPRFGSHAGLLTDAGIPAGSATVSLGKTGSFTIRLVLGHADYSLVGGFDLQGGFTGRIKRPGNSRIDVVLHLDPAAAGVSTISGTITADGITYDLAAMRAGFTPPPAGKFTLTLPPDPTQTDAASYPQGYGYVLVKVGGSGRVASAVGKLGDGQGFSLGGQFTDDLRWVIYTQPYANGKEGLLGGVISFTQATAPAIDELHGALHWKKPAKNEGAYPSGFGGDIGVEGSRFMSNPTLPASVLVTFNGGGIAIPNPLTVPRAGTRIYLAPGFALKLDPATGLFTGKFTIPSETKTRALNGVFLPKQERGTGFFRGDARQTGGFVLTPSP